MSFNPTERAHGLAAELALIDGCGGTTHAKPVARLEKALREARAEGMEAAAKICDSQRDHSAERFEMGDATTANLLACRIRALSGEVPTDG